MPRRPNYLACLVRIAVEVSGKQESWIAIALIQVACFRVNSILPGDSGGRLLCLHLPPS